MDVYSYASRGNNGIMGHESTQSHHGRTCESENGHALTRKQYISCIRGNNCILH